MGYDRRREWICLAIAAGVLGWAVFAFGSTRDIRLGDEIFWPVRTVAAWASGLGAIVCLLLLPGRGLLPRVAPGLAMGGGFLLAYGWFLVWNAHSDHSLETFTFDMIENRPVDWAPGTVARSTSLRVMIELSFVMLAVLAAVRAGGGSAWRSLFALLALAGAMVSLVGIFHKAADAPSIWWIDYPSKDSPNVFAPYYYNANAAAFMNLCLPLAMGLSLSRVDDEHGRAAGIFWAIISVLIIAGVVVAASKGGIIVLLLTLPVFLIWNHRRLRALLATFFMQRGRRIERVAILLVLGVVLLSLVAIGIAYVMKRWEEFASRMDVPGQEDVTGRLGIIKLMVRMAGWEEGSWHGFGPGTFQHLVPHFTVGMDDELEGVWRQGHCDPLQTLMEWGWIGAAAWLLVGGGAIACALILLRKKGRLLGDEEVPLLRGAIVALLMVGLHSCMDFPLSIYSIQLSAMLICGVCWGLYAERRAGARNRRSSA